MELRENYYKNPLGKIAVMIDLEFIFILLYRLCMKHIRKISVFLNRVLDEQTLKKLKNNKVLWGSKYVTGSPSFG